MRIPRIYTPQSLSQAFAKGQSLVLEKAPSHHLLRVLRLAAGRPLVLFNGEGGEYNATLTGIENQQAVVALNEFDPIDRESPLSIELVIGISKGDRFDWVLQKATELGVQRIIPLFTERTEVRLKAERLEKKHQHWQQISISAAEQCQRNRLPVIEMPQQFSQWQQRLSAQASDAESFEYRFVLHHRQAQSLPTKAPAPSSLMLLVGPEGGLAEQEIAQAKAKDFQPLTLGPRVMRTETAPLAAISCVQFTWGDWH